MRTQSSSSASSASAEKVEAGIMRRSGTRADRCVSIGAWGRADQPPIGRHAAAVRSVDLGACDRTRFAGPGLIALEEIVQGLAGLEPEAVALHRKAVDAIEAEGAEILAQLAPRRQQPDRPEIRKA